MLITSGIGQRLPTLSDAFNRDGVTTVTRHVTRVGPGIAIGLVSSFLAASGIATLLPDHSRTGTTVTRNRPVTILSYISSVGTGLTVTLRYHFGGLGLIYTNNTNNGVSPDGVAIDSLHSDCRSPLLTGLHGGLHRRGNVGDTLGRGFKVGYICSARPPHISGDYRANNLRYNNCNSTIMIASIITVLVIDRTLRLLVGRANI